MRTALLLLIVLTACQKKDQPSTPPPAQVKGVAYSWLGFPGSTTNLPAFYAEMATYKDTGVKWNGAWYDSEAQSGTVPAGCTAINEAAAANGFTPICVFGWRTGAT